MIKICKEDVSEENRSLSGNDKINAIENNQQFLNFHFISSQKE